MTKYEKKTPTKKKFDEQVEKLLQFACTEYDKSDFFQRNGEPVDLLIKKFQRVSGISFASVYIQNLAIVYLLKRELIEKVSVDGHRIGNTIYPCSRIRPTRLALLHLEERRKKRFAKYLSSIYKSNIAKFIIALIMSRDKRILEKTRYLKIVPTSITPVGPKQISEKTRQALLYWGVDPRCLVNLTVKNPGTGATGENRLVRPKRLPYPIKEDNCVIYADENIEDPN